MYRRRASVVTGIAVKVGEDRSEVDLRGDFGEGITAREYSRESLQATKFVHVHSHVSRGNVLTQTEAHSHTDHQSRRVPQRANSTSFRSTNGHNADEMASYWPDIVSA